VPQPRLTASSVLSVLPVARACHIRSCPPRRHSAQAAFPRANRGTDGLTRGGCAMLAGCRGGGVYASGVTTFALSGCDFKANTVTEDVNGQGSGGICNDLHFVSSAGPGASIDNFSTANVSDCQ
jgi:hypothetical protein